MKVFRLSAFVGRAGDGTIRARGNPGSLRRLLVVLMGHRTQRRMNAQAMLKTTAGCGLTAVDGRWFGGVGANKYRVRTLSTASGACVRRPAFFTFQFSPNHPCTVAALWESVPSRPTVDCFRAGPPRASRSPYPNH